MLYLTANESELGQLIRTLPCWISLYSGNCYCMNPGSSDTNDHCRRRVTAVDDPMSMKVSSTNVDISEDIIILRMCYAL
jgi:hypothetical protein